MSKTIEELRAIAQENYDRAIRLANTPGAYPDAPHWSAAAAHWVTVMIELDKAIAERPWLSDQQARRMKDIGVPRQDLEGLQAALEAGVRERAGLLGDE